MRGSAVARGGSTGTLAACLSLLVGCPYAECGPADSCEPVDGGDGDRDAGTTDGGSSADGGSGVDGGPVQGDGDGDGDAAPGCALLWPGDLTIADAEDLAAAAGVDCVEGDLVISHTSLTHLAGLESLRTVGGDVVISSNLELVDVTALVQLEEAQSLVVEHHPVLTTLSLPSLGLESGLLVWDLPALTLLDLPRVEVVLQGPIELIELPLLPDLEGLGNLRKAMTLRLVELPLVTDLDALGQMTDLDTLVLGQNESLVDVSGLAGVDGTSTWESRDLRSLGISGNPLLTSLDGLEGIRPLAIRVALVNNPALTDLSALSGVRHLHDFVFSGMPQTSLSAFSQLEQVAGRIQIDHNDALQTVMFPNLDYLFEVSIHDNPSLTSVSLPALPGTAWDFWLRNLPQLTLLGPLSSLVSIGDHPDYLGSLIVENTGLSDLSGFAALQSIDGALFLYDNPNLASLDGLGALCEVTADVGIAGNPLLPDADVDALLAQLAAGCP